MEHQDWNPVVVRKTPLSVPKPVSNKPSGNEVLDFNEKNVAFFTVAMGRKIAALRAQKQWTQEQLAKTMCIPKKTIVDIEQGKEKYSGPLVSKLKKALGNFSW